MRRFLGIPLALLVVAGGLMFASAAAMGEPGIPTNPRLLRSGPEMSGPAEFRDMEFGTTITECPQAGLSGADREHPLDRRRKDKAEQLSEGGDDVRANTDYSCFPQNETSIAINPITRRNILSSQNDYRTLSRQGFNASTDNGNNWYSAELPPLSVPDGDVLDASGDPVSVYDRAGIGYEAAINFNRTDDENGITVQRSTNGGYTWTRPCVPIPTTDPFTPATDPGRCGSIGDPRQPGDGVVTHFDDPDRSLCPFESTVSCPPFDDKEWLAAGPRPAGVGPVCYSPFTRDPRPCDPTVVGVDRLYVTWTRFITTGCDEEDEFEPPCEGRIWMSHSDDQARSWSPPKPISGTSSLCIGIFGDTTCDDNQFSVPTVHPKTGLLGVAFENFNTVAENQYLFVRSKDGGATFEGPFYVTPVFDVNYPRAGIERTDCTDRGQGFGRRVLTNSCYRVNAGGNVVVDKRGTSMTSGFGDDFYLVMSDNRNGTRPSTNTDVFFFRSTDGGTTWVGPTRVNNDRSDLGGVSRSCTLPRPAPAPPRPTDDPRCAADFGNDQWFPWVDVSNKGVLAVGFHDRRLDRNSQAHEWPMSRQRPGNYLAWFWGAGCKVDSTPSRECLAPGASTIPAPPRAGRPGPDPVPGQGASYLGPFRNAVISDVAHNLDYSFRAGIFMGDYNAVAFPNVPGDSRGHRGDDDDDDDDGGGGGNAVAFWTDSRNGRGSGNPTNPDTFQPGRNPACEQADVFVDWFNPLSSSSGHHATKGMEHFLVTPCPAGGTHRTDDGDNDNDDD
jgi:hypothetical protein